LKLSAQFSRVAFLLLIVGIFPAGLWSSPDDLQTSPKEISLAEYVTQLRAASAFLDGENPSGLHDFRVSLPSEWAVRTEGQSLRMKTDWLGIALLAQEKDPGLNVALLRNDRAHLAALLEAAEALQSRASRADLEQSRAKVNRILLEREFQGSHEPSWWDKQEARIRAWIARQLDKLFGRMGISASVGDAMAWTLVTLVGLLLSFWAVRSVINAAKRAEMDLSGAVPAGQDWRYWAKQARAAAERGDFRAAVHAAYWTAVAQLEENRLLPEDRSRTPRESLRLVERGHAAYGPLAFLTRRLELTWYGFQPATPDDWVDVKKQLEALDCLRNSTHATANS
jgi:hypothetical protein